MAHPSNHCCAFHAVIFAAAVAGSAAGETIWWANGTERLANGQANGAVWRAPDTLLSNTFGNDTHAVFDFSWQRSFTNVAGQLGIPQALYSQGEFIAFERNGSAPVGGGWESTRFTFSDGVQSATIDFNELTGTASLPWLLHTGSIAAPLYDDIFEIELPLVSPPEEVYSWVLFDVPPTFDLSSLRVTIEAGATYGLPGSGTPDPDAYALLVPAPSVVLPVVAVCLVWRGRRRVRYQ